MLPETMIPCRLRMPGDVLFARIRLLQRDVAGRRIARALQPADRPQFVAGGGRGDDVAERGGHVRIDLIAARALEMRGARRRRRCEHSELSGHDGSARDDIAAQPGIQPRDRRSSSDIACRVERRRRRHAGERARPHGGRRTRDQRDRETGRVSIDRHQSGRDVDALPGVNARDQQGGAAAARIGDVDVADREERLGPGAAVRPDARRIAGAEAAGVDAIGDQIRDRRIEQREQIAGGGKIPQRVDGDRGAERRSLGRLRVGGSRAREKAHEQDGAIQSIYGRHQCGHRRVYRRNQGR